MKIHFTDLILIHFVQQIGGSLAWSKHKQSANVNKRFVNKTVISTLIQNNIVRKTDEKQRLKAASLISESPALNNSRKQDETRTIGSSSVTINNSPASSSGKKIVISNKSRLNAYLKSKQLKMNEKVAESKDVG